MLLRALVLSTAVATAPATDRPPLPEPPQAGPPHVVQDSRPGMGSRFMILLWSADDAAAKHAIADAFAELDRLEAALSEWRPTSDISRVNQNAGKGPLAVGPDAFALLTRGKELSQLTGGALALSWAALGGM